MTADASSLRCPHCGAPADPGAHRCPFCKARLATISCPSCFALMFAEAAYCQACGTARARTDAAGGPPARCPGCREQLEGIQIGTTPLLECTRCDGLWVDAAVFERLCGDSEARAAVLHTTEGRHAATHDRVRYRPCARCGKMMNRVNFGRISGIIVDVCKGHGTFLDPGELQRVVRFVQDGGLDRARARQLEELRERERQLREAEARLARERGRADPRQSIQGWDNWTFLVGE